MAGPIIQDVAVGVYHQNTPSSDTPDVMLDLEHLLGITIDEKAADLKDEGGIDAVYHPDPSQDLRMGDRVEISATLEPLDGGSTQSIDWTGRVLTTDHTRDDPGQLGGTLASEVTDYVAGVLSERQITGSWVNEDVGQIIRDICEQKASEIDCTNVPDMGVSTDLFAQNTDCWDTVNSLAARADAIVFQSGIELRVEPVGNLTHQFDLVENDYIYPWETTIGDEVKNVVRVDSGTNRQEESSQSTHDSWQRVTQSSRLTYRLRARKSSLHSIDLMLRQASDEKLKLRLQADENGSPVEIGSEDSDVDSASWDSDNLPNEGRKDFFFSGNTLPDRDPWLIVETDGDTGHDIAVNSNGVPVFTSYYPHPISYEDTSTESIDEYGSREIRIQRDNLDTLAATEDAVQQELARRAWPEKTVSFEANSARAHALETGDIITVDKPEEDAVGDFIVTEVSHDLDAESVMLQTEVEATWRKGILAPQ